MKKIKWFILPILMIVAFVLVGEIPTKAYYISNHVENIYNYVPSYQNPVIVEFEGSDMDMFFSGALYSDNVEVSQLSTLTAEMLDNNFPIGWSNVVLFPLSLGSNFWSSSTDSIKELAYIVYFKTTSNTVVMSFYNLKNQLVFSSTNLYIDTPSIYYPRTSNVQYEFQKGYDNGYFDGYEDGLYEGSKLSYDMGYDYGYNLGYGHGYDRGIEEGSEIMENTKSLFEAVLSFISDVFQVSIFPGVTIGTLFMIPISFAMFKWFLKIIG